MARKYPGLYLYFDWLKGLVKLPPEVAMKIIENLYHYAEDGLEPEPMEEMCYNIIQDMYMDQLKRSKEMEALGRKGGLTTSGKDLPSFGSRFGMFDFDEAELSDEVIDREIAEARRRKRALEEQAKNAARIRS